jgi:hypothetical protein
VVSHRRKFLEFTQWLNLLGVPSFHSIITPQHGREIGNPGRSGKAESQRAASRADRFERHHSQELASIWGVAVSLGMVCALDKLAELTCP